MYICKYNKHCCILLCYTKIFRATLTCKVFSQAVFLISSNKNLKKDSFFSDNDLEEEPSVSAEPISPLAIAEEKTPVVISRETTSTQFLDDLRTEDVSPVPFEHNNQVSSQIKIYIYTGVSVLVELFGYRDPPP